MKIYNIIKRLRSIKKIISLFLFSAILVSCGDLGKKLGYKTRDIPLDPVNSVKVYSDSVTAVTKEISFSEVSFPSNIWTPDAVGFPLESVSFTGVGSESTGTITVSVLVDDHPLGAWEVTVSNGSIEEVNTDCLIDCEGLDDSMTLIPGFQLSGGRADNVASLGSNTIELMHMAYMKLPQEKRPDVVEGMEYILEDNARATTEEKREIFRATASGLNSKELKISLMVHSLGDVEGELLLDHLKFRIFDGGQGLLS